MVHLRRVWGAGEIAAVAVMLAVPYVACAQDVEPPVTQVEDVVVVGERLIERSERFTEAVAGPAPGRGIARWRGPVCVAVANFRPETAAWIADRVVATGADLGVPIQEPECEPNVLIVGAADADALIAEWVETAPAQFRSPFADTGATRSALATFMESDAPVRWWQVSVPKHYDVFTGRSQPTCCGMSVRIQVYARSQLRHRIRDDLHRVVVVVDVDRLEGVTGEQLADYLTLVAFAQVDPAADTAGFDTILNLFGDAAPPGLTRWDRAYVRAMYASPDDQRWNRHDQAAGVRDVLEGGGRED